MIPKSIKFVKIRCSGTDSYFEKASLSLSWRLRKIWFVSERWFVWLLASVRKPYLMYDLQHYVFPQSGFRNTGLHDSYGFKSRSEYFAWVCSKLTHFVFVWRFENSLFCSFRSKRVDSFASVHASGDSRAMPVSVQGVTVVIRVWL